jgi:hypothetical protein
MKWENGGFSRRTVILIRHLAGSKGVFQTFLFLTTKAGLSA